MGTLATIYGNLRVTSIAWLALGRRPPIVLGRVWSLVKGQSPLGLFFHFVFSNNFRTLVSFFLRLAGLAALTAGNVWCKGEWNRMKDKKSYSKKQSKKNNIFIVFFFCFFGLFFPPNFRTLWSFCVFLASKNRGRRPWFLETKNKEIEWKTKKLQQKNKMKKETAWFLFSFCFF